MKSGTKDEDKIERADQIYKVNKEINKMKESEGFGDAEYILTGDFNTDLKKDKIFIIIAKLIGLKLPDNFPDTVNKVRSSMQ